MSNEYICMQLELKKPFDGRQKKNHLKLQIIEYL